MKVFRALLILVFTAVLTCSRAAFAGDVSLDAIFSDGFEPVPPTYAYVWSTDQFVVGQAGGTYVFQVAVYDALGSLVDSDDLAWSATDPQAVTLLPLGPRSVQATVGPGGFVGVLGIVAQFPGAANSATAQLVFGTLQPQARFVPSALVVSADATSATFLSAPETDALAPGNVILTGSETSLLVSIVSIQKVAGQWIAQTQPAGATDFFSSLGDEGVQLRSDTVPVRLSVRNGVATVRNFQGRLLQQTPLSASSVTCTGGLGVGLDVSKITFDKAYNVALTFQPKFIPLSVELIVSGDWNANLTIEPAALTGSLFGDVHCSVAFPSIPTPASTWIFAAKAGLLINPSLNIDLTVSGDVSIVTAAEFTAHTSGEVTFGISWDEVNGWQTLHSAYLSSTHDLEGIGTTLSQGVSVDAKAYARAEAVIGISALDLVSAQAPFVDVDLGAALTLNLEPPFSPNALAYTGPSGEFSGYAHGELTAPGLLDPLLERIHRAFSVIPSSISVALPLFDTRFDTKTWSPAMLFTTPGYLTPPYTGTVQAAIDGLQPASSGNFQIVAYSPDDSTTPVWTSPSVPFAAGVANYSFPGTSIVGASGQLSGPLTLQVRLRYGFDPVTAAFPLASDSSTSLDLLAASGGPSVSGVTPNPVPGLNGSQTLTINGSNFVSGATATLVDIDHGGTYVKSTAFIDSGQLTVSANFTNTSSRWSVKVTNPDSSVSNALTFSVTAGAPSISNVSPNPVPGLDAIQTLTINGGNFASGATATLVDVGHGGTYVKSTTFVNSGQLTLSADFTSTASTWSVKVTNPDSSVSNTFPFSVTAGPSISNVSPNPVLGLNGSQTLTVYGSNFVNGATATLVDIDHGGFPYNKATTYVNAGQLTLSANFTSTASTWSVKVTNPDSSASNTFNFAVTAGAPSISNVSPNPVPGLNSSQTLTINGGNFVSGATATLVDIDHGGTYGKATTFINSGQLILSANFTSTASMWSVKVANPDSSVSNTFTFSVAAGAPSISSVSPNPVPGLNASQTLTINGSNFVSGATATLVDIDHGGTYVKSTTYMNSGQLTLSANFTRTASTWSVKVTNPDSSVSNTFIFSVTAGVPSVSGVSPNPVPGLNASQTLTINGSNFVSGATATLVDIDHGGTYAKSTTFINSGQLTLSANFTNTASTWSVKITNPDSSVSNTFNFSVTAGAPSISSVSPNPVPGLNTSQTLTINGSNFVSGATATLVDVGHGGTYVKSTTSISSNQLTLSANFTSTASTWSVKVTNPDSSVSNTFNFSVAAGGPSIGGVSPNPVPGLNTSQTLTINGSNFVSGATATLVDIGHGGTYVKSTSYISSGQLTLSANFTDTASTWSVKVTNPDSSVSNTFNFSVAAGAPSISGVSPNPVPGLNASQTLTINGSSFISGATATLVDIGHGGTYVKSTFYISSGQLTLSANFTSTPSTWSVKVTNSDSQVSNTFNFTVQ